MKTEYECQICKQTSELNQLLGGCPTCKNQNANLFTEVPLVTVGSGMSYATKHIFCQIVLKETLNGNGLVTVDLEDSDVHALTLGKTGKATKEITFKEQDFKAELAPKNARILRFVKDGEPMVRMTYHDVFVSSDYL